MKPQKPLLTLRKNKQTFLIAYDRFSYYTDFMTSVFLKKPMRLAWGGYLVLGFIGILSIGVLTALLGYSDQKIWTIFTDIIADSYTLYIIYFSFLQAGLSTFIAIFIAIPVARFLYRRQFWGRDYLLKLFVLAFIMPVIVSVFGIIAVHGRQGFFNDILAGLGFNRLSYLYGLSGILLAHIFINMPFSAKIFLNELENIPAEYWRLSKQLGFTEWQIFKQIEWPIMRLSLPSLASLLFILHFTSFAIILTLGGGPAATTLEVAIYQSLKFDFDLSKGAVLALLQMGFCIIFTLFLHRFSNQINILNSVGKGIMRPAPLSKLSYITDGFMVLILLVFLILPLSSVFINALMQSNFSILSLPIFWRALSNSLVLAVSAATIASLMSITLLLSKRALATHNIKNIGYHLFSSAGNIILIIPSLVFGMGLFLLLRNFINIFDYGLYIVLIVNALMALPYMLKMLEPAVNSMSEKHKKLCLSLGINGLNRLKIIDWATLRKPLSRASALAATISFGDFGVIALFGNDITITLPMLLYQSLGSYRSGESAIIALTLVILAFFVYTIIERIIGGRNVRVK